MPIKPKSPFIILKDAFVTIFSHKYNFLVFLIMGVVGTILTFLVNLGINSLNTLLANVNNGWAILFSFVLLLLNYLIPVILLFIYLFVSYQIVKYSKVSFSDVFTKLKSTFFKYLWVSVCLGLLVGLGLILLIVPGIILAIRYFFAPTVSVIENKGVKASLKESREMTKKKFWRILFAFIVINLLTGIPKMIFNSVNPTIALIWTVFDPLNALFMILLYNNLLSQEELPTVSQPMPQIPPQAYSI